MSAQIAIVGGGPAGLTLARLLELNAISYTVFERDASRDTVGQGGSLDIHVGSGQLALEACGLMNEFRKASHYDGQELKVLDSQGNLLMHREYTGQTKAPEIDRGDLREILLNSIPEDRIRWGVKIDKVERGEDGKMAVHLLGGKPVTGFDLVVGADGAWSKVRKLVTDAMPQYSGFHYLQSDILTSNANYPRLAAAVGPGSLISIGSALQIAVQRMSDKRYNTYVCLALPESWSKTNQEYISDPTKFRQSLLQHQFANWSDGLKDYVRHSEGPIYAWPLYALPVEAMSWKTVPGVALIGDAAHLSTPFVGEGVNCSMHDSLQLAQSIVKHGVNDLTRAVEEYERQMFPRAIDLITRSNGSKDIVLAENAPEKFKEMIASMS